MREHPNIGFNCRSRLELGREEILPLVCRADRVAGEIMKSYRLGRADRADIRQDLLVDVFARLKNFDPARGSLQVFAATVMANRAVRIAWCIRRERSVFAPLSLDEPVEDGEGTLGEAVAEADSYLAMMGQPVDSHAIIDRNLDVGRALGALNQPDLIFCKHLLNQTPAELNQAGHGSRAGLYRQLADIRLELTARGLALAA